MRASSLGEFGLIERIRRLNGSKADRRVILGIGDDAAVFRPSAGCDLLLTTDLLLEGVHFRRETARLTDIGYKAVAVNVSDIAAMGGIPRCYLVSLTLPHRFPVEGVDEIYRGMREAAREAGLALAGGNTAAAPDRLAIDITVVGEVKRGKAVTRSGARPGDFLFVTGTLGDAAAGLEILARRAGGGTTSPFLVRRHRRPKARWREGRLLATVASAMVDLSDGLSSDLSHLSEASGTGAVVAAGLLPLSGPLRSYCRAGGRNPLGYALHGGEDYELLFAVPRRGMDRLISLVRRGELKATPIGKVVSRRGCWLTGRDGNFPLRPEGYDHFRNLGFKRVAGRTSPG